MNEKKNQTDKVVEIPISWWKGTEQKKILYFIPDWDDLVDSEYDYRSDVHSVKTCTWSNQVYSHQLFQEPNYDGILVSKIIADKIDRKKQTLNNLGIHRYLRVPSKFPVMGDCGAFGYIDKDNPPFSTKEIIDYYTTLGFNYGVSIDHLIVTSTENEKLHRYELTIHNADEFLNEHKKLRLPWQPIGAVQGWDTNSFVKAAKKYANMGYEYIGLGGLVRSKTEEILHVLESVRKAIPERIKIHLFGIGRLSIIKNVAKIGANSIDSASYLRKAWLGSDKNYLTEKGWYSAIRIPQTDRSFRAKRLANTGKVSLKKLKKLELECLKNLRSYAEEKKKPSDILINLLVEYDTLVAGHRKGTRERILRTLGDRPWEKCTCEVCRELGIEVIIFRGNNRNRRRGFHNTYIFYKLIDLILAGREFEWIENDRRIKNNKLQLKLF